MEEGGIVLTCIRVQINNNPYRGGIEIKSKANGSLPSGVNQITIKRKELNGSTWITLITKTISKVTDLTFDSFDILANSNCTYEYVVDVYKGETPYQSQLFTVECWFDGMFVGNFDRQYFAFANCETETKRITQVEYVTTLSGRTPYRVSNADTNYTTGTSKGLFFDLDQNGNPVPDYNHQFSNDVVDFLTDGSSKILKTSDGQIWYVSIDDTIELPYHERYLGYNEIGFNWTEIGDVPPFGLVIDNE